MRKSILLILFICVSIFAFSQTVNITFELNVATLGSDLDSSNVYVGGYSGVGGPTDNQMTDPDNDSIYTVTIQMPYGFSGYYTFLNGNCSDWSCKENITGLACAEPNFGDRFLPVVLKDTIIKACFGSCISDGSCTTSTTSTNGLLVDNDLFTLQPTIVNNYANVSFGDNVRMEEKQITVVNAVGQVMIAKTVNNIDQYQIDARNFTNGVYFINVSTRKTKLTKKFMVIQ